MGIYGDLLYQDRSKTPKWRARGVSTQGNDVNGTLDFRSTKTTSLCEFLPLPYKN